MNPTLINIALMPPDKPGSEDDQDAIERVIAFIRKQELKPEQVFPVGMLMEWAEKNGYILL